MIKTFKNILNDIEQFCLKHHQIKDFGWGPQSNISTKDHKFVMVWLTPTSSSISGHLMTLSFEMLVFDIVKQDLSNLKEVLNDTLLIGNDVVSRFWSDEDTYGWVLNENTVTMMPFDAKFDDFCAGWVFKIDIEIEDRLSICNIPLNENN